MTKTLLTTGNASADPPKERLFLPCEVFEKEFGVNEQRPSMECLCTATQRIPGYFVSVKKLKKGRSIEGAYTMLEKSECLVVKEQVRLS